MDGGDEEGAVQEGREDECVFKRDALVVEAAVWEVGEVFVVGENLKPDRMGRENRVIRQRAKAVSLAIKREIVRWQRGNVVIVRRRTLRGGTE